MPKLSSQLSLRRGGAELEVDVEVIGGSAIGAVAPLADDVVVALLRWLP
jgi:hypothetical protein